MKTEYNKKDLIEVLKKIRNMSSNFRADSYKTCIEITKLVDHVLEVIEINGLKKKD